MGALKGKRGKPDLSDSMLHALNAIVQAAEAGIEYRGHRHIGQPTLDALERRGLVERDPDAVGRPHLWNEVRIAHGEIKDAPLLYKVSDYTITPAGRCALADAIEGRI